MKLLIGYIRLVVGSSLLFKKNKYIIFLFSILCLNRNSSLKFY
uniref:Uncharacterized protein n=1 Tax=Periphykon beckeri TaxID=2006982 RepID=A0A1Z1M3R4_9FLOR|nr:hypothetical protein [Periphykon beckeri]ARW60471.1 hypothetical protein [Periphykon beckeri]